MKRAIKVTKITIGPIEKDETYLFNWFTEERMKYGIQLVDISVPRKDVFYFLVKGKKEDVLHLLQRLITNFYPMYIIE